MTMNATEQRQIARALAVPFTYAEAEAVYQALGQFVENEECADCYDDPETESEHLVAARTVLDRMDAALQALAERIESNG